MATTTNGFPYPVSGDNNDVPADMQALAQEVDDQIHTRVGARVRRLANQTISSVTAMQWDQEDEDTDGFLTAPAYGLVVPSGAAGVYVITAGFASDGNWGDNSADVAWLLVDDVPTANYRVNTDVGPYVSSHFHSITVVSALAVGYDVQLYITSATSQNFTGKLQMFRVSP